MQESSKSCPLDYGCIPVAHVLIVSYFEDLCDFNDDAKSYAWLWVQGDGWFGLLDSLV